MLAVFYILTYFALVFDRPESERLADRNELVFFSDEFIQTLFGFFVFRITRNYAVNERIAIVVLLVVPLFEFFGKLPKVDILIHALFEFVGVVIYKFHGQNIRPAKTRVKPFKQKFSKFRGVSYILETVKIVLGVKTYSRLGSV